MLKMVDFPPCSKTSLISASEVQKWVLKNVPNVPIQISNALSDLFYCWGHNSILYVCVCVSVCVSSFYGFVRNREMISEEELSCL